MMIRHLSFKNHPKISLFGFKNNKKKNQPSISFARIKPLFINCIYCTLICYILKRNRKEAYNIEYNLQNTKSEEKSHKLRFFFANRLFNQYRTRTVFNYAISYAMQ